MKDYIILLLCILFIFISYIILKITTLEHGINYDLIKKIEAENNLL
jgi:hypothetical protein